jgi:hypothetical protein
MAFEGADPPMGKEVWLKGCVARSAHPPLIISEFPPPPGQTAVAEGRCDDA